MPDDFSGTIEQVRDFAEDLNAEEIDTEPIERPVEDDSDEADPDTEEGTRLRVFPENFEGPIYNIIGYPSDRFFTLDCSFSLVSAIAGELIEETADDILAEHPVEYDESYFQHFVPADEEDDLNLVAAAIAWLESLDEDDVDQIVYSLSEIFATAPVKNQIHTTPSGEGIIGFRVHEKIFPYESDFTIRTFNNSVERVRLPAHLGELYLSLTFNLGINEARDDSDRDFETEVSTDPEI